MQKAFLKRFGFFSIALMAELTAALGWLEAQYDGDGDLVFNVLSKLVEYERPRLLP
jgi:hypothetical protein